MLARVPAVTQARRSSESSSESPSPSLPQRSGTVTATEALTARQRFYTVIAGAALWPGPHALTLWCFPVPRRLPRQAVRRALIGTLNVTQAGG